MQTLLAKTVAVLTIADWYQLPEAERSVLAQYLTVRQHVDIFGWVSFDTKGSAHISVLHMDDQLCVYKLSIWRTYHEQHNRYMWSLRYKKSVDLHIKQRTYAYGECPAGHLVGGSRSTNLMSTSVVETVIQEAVRCGREDASKSAVRYDYYLDGKLWHMTRPAPRSVLERHAARLRKSCVQIDKPSDIEHFAYLRVIFVFSHDCMMYAFDGYKVEERKADSTTMISIANPYKYGDYKQVHVYEVEERDDGWHSWRLIEIAKRVDDMTISITAESHDCKCLVILDNDSGRVTDKLDVEIDDEMFVSDVGPENYVARIFSGEVMQSGYCEPFYAEQWAGNKLRYVRILPGGYQCDRPRFVDVSLAHQLRPNALALAYQLAAEHDFDPPC